MGKIRVLLVDDHTVVRQGLRRILETDEEIEIVGETGDGRSAA
jgi:two-component system, NarL family, response regulator DegU